MRSTRRAPKGRKQTGVHRGGGKMRRPQRDCRGLLPYAAPTRIFRYRILKLCVTACGQNAEDGTSERKVLRALCARLARWVNSSPVTKRPRAEHTAHPGHRGETPVQSILRSARLPSACWVALMPKLECRRRTKASTPSVRNVPDTSTRPEGSSAAISIGCRCSAAWRLNS